MLQDTVDATIAGWVINSTSSGQSMVFWYPNANNMVRGIVLDRAALGEDF
jgi:hypothetical protein